MNDADVVQNDSDISREPHELITQTAASNAIFGSRVRSARQTRQMPSWKVARLCGISRTYLLSIERGNGVRTLDVIQRLAKALELDFEMLTRGIDLQPVVFPRPDVRINWTQHASQLDTSNPVGATAGDREKSASQARSETPMPYELLKRTNSPADDTPAITHATPRFTYTADSPLRELLVEARDELRWLRRQLQLDDSTPAERLDATLELIGAINYALKAPRPHTVT